MSQNLYWKYRAVDDNLDATNIHSGVHKCHGNHLDAIVELRQQGLQVIELQPISKERFNAEVRLLKMQERLNIRVKPKVKEPSKPLQIRWNTINVILILLLIILCIYFALT